MVSSEVLSRHLYGGQLKPKPKFIDVFACHLPIKRGQTMGGRRYIETVWGRGYRLSDPAQEPLHSQT